MSAPLIRYDEAAKRTPPTNLRVTAFREELKAVLLKGIAERLESGAAGGGGATAAAAGGGGAVPDECVRAQLCPLRRAAARVG